VADEQEHTDEKDEDEDRPQKEPHAFRIR